MGVTAEAPAIDVVIPTLNCEGNLRRCLGGIFDQDYSGDLRLTIVDGGSTDGTVDVAREAGATIVVHVGQYATGLSGARHSGEQLGSAPLVWILDSDNQPAGRGLVSALVTPLQDDPTVQLSVPLLHVEAHQPSFNRWLAWVEETALERELARGTDRGTWVSVDPLMHGISNAAMIRRSALRSAGGYDSDVRLLQRLRRRGLARAALVPFARIVHHQVESGGDFMRKAARRLNKFSRMTDQDLRNYFVEYPIPHESEEELQRGVVRSLVAGPREAMQGIRRTRDRAWLWGLVYPLMAASLVARHPWASWKVYNRFL